MIFADACLKISLRKRKFFNRKTHVIGFGGFAVDKLDKGVGMVFIHNRNPGNYRPDMFAVGRNIFKIPAFKIVRKLGIALKEEGMFKFREYVLFH